MKILITGSKGFIGRNLIERLSKDKSIKVLEFDLDTPFSLLEEYCKECDFVFNFAAVHRPLDTSEFKKVNFEQFDYLLKLLEKYNNNCPVLYTSSIQSNNGTDYGASKFLAEESLRKHGALMNSRAIVYRLTNTFGKWARPNSHSVVATFCYNAAHNLRLVVSNPDIIMHFAYIDDVIDSFAQRLSESKNIKQSDSTIYSIDSDKIINISLGNLKSLILSFVDKADIAPNNNYMSREEALFFKTFLSYKD